MGWFSKKEEDNDERGFNVPVQYPDGTVWWRTKKGAESAEQDGAVIRHDLEEQQEREGKKKK